MLPITELTHIILSFQKPRLTRRYVRKACGNVMNWKAGIVILAVTLVGGCYSPDPKSIHSSSAASAIPAIKTAAATNDRKAIPRLVEALDDHDPAIRFAAIAALKKMTGQDFDYRYYDGEWDRRLAVQRWRDWLKANPSP